MFVKVKFTAISRSIVLLLKKRTERHKHITWVISFSADWQKRNIKEASIGAIGTRMKNVGKRYLNKFTEFENKLKETAGKKTYLAFWMNDCKISCMECRSKYADSLEGHIQEIKHNLSRREKTARKTKSIRNNIE